MEEQYSPVPAHHNVPVPFAADIPDVFPGKSILIKGMLLNSTQDHRFLVDLCCGKLVQGDHQDNKALHVNPRFDPSGSIFSKPDRDIVLNSLINNAWGAEQRCHNTLERGKPFSIRILMLRDYFKISMNGKHLADYIHRVPLETIKCIYIQGCVTIDLIEYQGTRPNKSSPTPSAPSINSEDFNEPIEVSKPEIPFVFQVHYGGFPPPRELLIILTPLLNASYFSVNILRDSEHLFHMRVDFPNQNGAGERGAIVRNSTSEGVWQREERQLGRFPFTLGITSDLKIVADVQGLKVFVDGSFFCDFAYRSSGPLPTEVNKISIVGDVGVQKFVFRNRVNPSGEVVSVG